MTTQLALPLPVIEATQPSSLTLRDYQEETIAAIDEARALGITRGLVALPTGTGKTVIFSHVVGQRSGSMRGHALILVHRDELVQQAIDKLQTVNPGMQLGIIKAELNQPEAQIVVASVQTLVRERRMKTAQDHWRATGGLHTVVVDEAHHSEADSWQSVLHDLGCFETSGPLTLGFTATPERADGKGLGNTWQKVVYQKAILEMIKAGYLSDVRGLRIRLEGFDLSSVKKSHGDYQDGALSEAMDAADAPEHIADAWLEHAKGRKTLVFTPTIEMAQFVAQAMQDKGIAADWVSGQLDQEVRRAKLRSFRQGSIEVLTNAMLLTEGYDEPGVSCVVVARPTKSHALYVQQVGRGTRPFPGKSDLLVMDVVGASAEHQLVTIVDLVGFEPKPGCPAYVEGESLLEAESRIQGFQSKMKGRLVAETVDLFGRSAFRWTVIGENRFVLNLGTESLMLRQTGDLWSVYLRNEGTEAVQQVYQSQDIGYAQGWGEDFARRHEGKGLANKKAKWLSDPPTEKQLEFLKQERIVADGMTKGDASDIISGIIERRKWRRS